MLWTMCVSCKMKFSEAIIVGPLKQVISLSDVMVCDLIWIWWNEYLIACVQDPRFYIHLKKCTERGGSLPYATSKEDFEYLANLFHKSNSDRLNYEWAEIISLIDYRIHVRAVGLCFWRQGQLDVVRRKLCARSAAGARACARWLARALRLGVSQNWWLNHPTRRQFLSTSFLHLTCLQIWWSNIARLSQKNKSHLLQCFGRIPCTIQARLTTKFWL